MSIKYPRKFGTCLSCKVVFHSTKLKPKCPRCEMDLEQVRDIVNEWEYQTYRKEIKKHIHQSHKPTHIEIPALSLEVSKNPVGYKVIRIKYMNSNLITVRAGSFDSNPNTDNLLTPGSKYDQYLGYLDEILIDQEHYETIEKLLVGREELLGCYFESSRKEKILYIRPNKSDYLKIFDEISKENHEIQERREREEEIKREIERENERVRVKERIERERIASEESERTRRRYLEDKRRAIELHKAKNSGVFSFFTPKLRETHCYRCDRALFSSTHPECSTCKWLICSCGSCGCQYMK